MYVLSPKDLGEDFSPACAADSLKHGEKYALVCSLSLSSFPEIHSPKPQIGISWLSN